MCMLTTQDDAVRNNLHQLKLNTEIDVPSGRGQELQRVGRIGTNLAKTSQMLTVNTNYYLPFSLKRSLYRDTEVYLLT